MAPEIAHLRIGKTRICDARALFPNVPAGSTGRKRMLSQLVGVAVHHDGVLFEPGDHDYNGSTLDEDLGRLQAIYAVCLDRGWGGFCYHFVASPNGRLFYTQDVRNFGAHVARRNHELLGVAIMGDYSFHGPPVAAKCAAGLGLLAAWHESYRFLPVMGHSAGAPGDWPTRCPGVLWAWEGPTILRFAALHGRLAFGGAEPA